MLEFKKEDMVIQPKIHKNTLVFLPGWSRSALVDYNIFRNVPFLKNTRIRIVQSPHREIIKGSNRTLPSWFMLDISIPGSLMPGLNETSRMIDEILQEEYEICNKVFLGGFSQGGVTALYTGLVMSTVPVVGVFALSCFIPMAKFKESRKKIPLFIFHGEKDEIVDQKNTLNMISKAFNGFNLTYKTDDKLGHTYSWKEFIELKTWMTACLSIEKL